MNRATLRFFSLFGVSLLLATVVLAVLLFGRWWEPTLFGPLLPRLPEDFLIALVYELLAEILRWIPALALSSVVLAASFQIQRGDLSPKLSAALVQVSSLAVLVAVIVAGSELLAKPWITARLDDFQLRFHQTLQLEDAYLRIKAKGTDQQSSSDLQTRLSLISRLGLMRPAQGHLNSPERIDYDFEFQILKAHLELDEFFRLRAVSNVLPSEPESSLSVDQMLFQAEQALSQGKDQEFQANLWGFQAYRRLMNAAEQGKLIEQGLLDRAKEVVEQSWTRIYEKTLSYDERKKASYFFRKGKSLGDFKFQNYLEAYYGFQELHLENPQDQEVVLHWELSRQKIADQVLFNQDMEVLFVVPGSENLVFLNKKTPAEVVKIGKVLNTSQGVFVKDFELLRFDNKGTVLLHWTAPYGKWNPHGIDFRVWDKNLPTPFFPVVLTETPGDEFNATDSLDPPLFLPNVTVRDLELVNSDKPRPQTLETWNLLTHGQAIEALGYNPILFQTEFLVRLLEPFVMFMGFLVAFAVSWKRRIVDQNRTWWVLFPLLPLVMGVLMQIVEWAGRLALGGLLHVGDSWEITILFLVGIVVAGSVFAVALVGINLRKMLNSD